MLNELSLKRRTLFAAAAGVTVGALGMAAVAHAATRGGKLASSASAARRTARTSTPQCRS